MIDGESNKAEQLRSSKCSSGDMISYSDAYLIKTSQDFTAKRHVKHQLYQSDDRRHGVDCVHFVFQRSFDHIDHLETLELCVKLLAVH